MKWSKQKQIIENNFALSLKGRVQVHSTRYRGAHDELGRAWITVDKKEIINMCSIKWEKEYLKLTENNDILDLQEQQNCEAANNNYFFSNDTAHKKLRSKELYSQYDFYHALQTFMNMSVQDVLNSGDNLVMSLAILDKRVGKRTLKRFKNVNTGFSLFSNLFIIRCEAEGIRLKPEKVIS